jgi:hypothetical protein
VLVVHPAVLELLDSLDLWALLDGLEQQDFKVLKASLVVLGILEQLVQQVQQVQLAQQE